MTPEADLLARAMNLVWDYRELCRAHGFVEQAGAAQNVLDEYECMVLENDETA